MRWAVLMLAVVGLSACADSDSMAASDVSRCPDGAVTESLEVTPDRVTRGAPVEIDVRWEILAPVPDPALATLLLGPASEIQVEIPLAEDFTDSSASTFIYMGSVLNPFGSGAPAGTVAVDATGGMESGCTIQPSASTSFELE